jgi:hypothetical protein
MIAHSTPAGGSDHGLARPNYPLSMRERRHLAPSRATKTAVSLAVAQLPLQQRHRYAMEFWAEIHDIQRDEQLPYALALLMHAPALRAAVSGAKPPTLEAPVKRVDWQHVPCWLTFHHYMKLRSPDGEMYVECSRCGKYRHSQGISPAAWA